MGIHYLEGEGTGQDIQKGLKMLKLSARKDPEALLYLGCAYRDGFNLEQNIDLSVKNLRKAASLKNTDSCLILGDMHSTREYGLYNARKAAKYYLKGAKMDDISCMEKVIVMYRNGWLVTKNEKKADMWQKRHDEIDAKIYE